MSSPNLAIVHVAASQNQKEVTVNAAVDALDGALAGLFAHAMTDANYTVPDADAIGNMVFKFTGALTAGRNIVVPVNKKLYMVSNGTSGGFNLTVKTPSGTGIAVTSAAFVILYCDGTNVITIQ